jgi:hypothetical protein
MASSAFHSGVLRLSRTRFADSAIANPGGATKTHLAHIGGRHRNGCDASFDAGAKSIANLIRGGFGDKRYVAVV